MTSVSEVAPRTPAGLDVERVRQDFPILGRLVRGKPLVYLDNAATSHKPRQVIDAVSRFYGVENANIHRGVYFLSDQATSAYEAARAKVQRFLNAADPHEIVFVRSTTEAINLAAASFGRTQVGDGDEIVLSAMEHHSNIVPWQLICEAVGARLRVIPMNGAGELLMDEYEQLLGERTKLVAIVHVSNSLGTVNPVKEVVSLARQRGIPVLVDGAQAAPHGRIDVQDLDCDFYTISGHKMFGPTGVGALFGRAEHLERMPPYQGGGDMIRTVTFEKSTFAAPPARFEAGTPNIAGAIGLGVAIDYLTRLGWESIHQHEVNLLQYATERLSAIPGLQIIGTAAHKISVVSFVMNGVHPHDIGTILDQEGVAVRTGHHCTQPVMDFFGVPATARASFAFYNTREEVDKLAEQLGKVCEVFG